jgi:hypothetical protein
VNLTSCAWAAAKQADGAVEAWRMQKRMMPTTTICLFFSESRERTSFDVVGQ